MATQLQNARQGKITPEMKAVAKTENLSVSTVLDEIAAGRLVIPANRIHLESNLVPVAIGRIASIKVNANIGTSSTNSNIDEELEKLKTALDAGADAMMDLSTGGDLDDVRTQMLANCPVTFGTVPIYEVILDRDIEDITAEIVLQTIEKQASQGVDFFTIHAGLLREHLPLAAKRVCGIVSRGGALMAKWMLHYDRQNLLYEIFDDICDIMVKYDVCFSLGDGLRPGCIADATDDAQIAELKVLGQLTAQAQARGCQVMVEGPGHVPFDQIQRNMELQQKYCNGAPFYVLGPLVTDIAPGYDHITSAMGGVAAGYYGASFLCYVTPREHLGLPDAQDVRQGVIAAKIAAHAADVARGHPGAADRDLRLSTARAKLDWNNHLSESLDPAGAKAMHDSACSKSNQPTDTDADFCTMCGRNWCSVRINKEIVETASKLH